MFSVFCFKDAHPFGQARFARFSCLGIYVGIYGTSLLSHYPILENLFYDSLIHSLYLIDNRSGSAAAVRRPLNQFLADRFFAALS